MRIAARSFLVAILGLWVVDASAATLYKLVDPNGHVTYTDARPREFGGDVVRLDIDTSVNAVAPVAPPQESQAQMENERIIRGRPDTGTEDRIQAARARVEAAASALDAAMVVPGSAAVSNIPTDDSDTLTDDSESLTGDSDTLTDDSDSPADAPGEPDYYFVQVHGGNGNHGVRLVYSEQYAARLVQLTQDLESAKRELAALENSR